MPVFLDNLTLETDTLGYDASIGQALEAAKARMQGTGRLILALRCNEEDVDAEQILDLLSAPLGDFERLDFISGRPEEAVIDALKGIRRAFEDTFPVAKEAGDALTAGDARKAMSLLGDCFNIWGQTHETVITSGRLLALDFDTLQIDARPLTKWITQLAEKLREMKAAIESRDNVLLGDILRYEMDATLQEWERMLGGLIDHIEQTLACETQPRAAVPHCDPVQPNRIAS